MARQPRISLKLKPVWILWNLYFFGGITIFGCGLDFQLIFEIVKCWFPWCIQADVKPCFISFVIILYSTLYFCSTLCTRDINCNIYTKTLHILDKLYTLTHTHTHTHTYTHTNTHTYTHTYSYTCTGNWKMMFGIFLKNCNFLAERERVSTIFCKFFKVVI